MNLHDTALILIGFQNDYFSAQGVLHSFIEDPDRLDSTLRNTLGVIQTLSPTDMLMITTPIIFTPSYEELHDPVGILKAIQDAGAFRAGTAGSETVPELRRYGDRLLEVPGKRGLNAFSNTELDAVLRQRGIANTVIAGVVASICIDSTGRAAFERGYGVTILSDCVSGRTSIEEEFYRSQIYPLYAETMTSGEFLNRLAADT